MIDFAAAAPELLLPTDPAPFRVFNAEGAAPILVVCDHASNAVPARLQGLGLLERDLHRHIAYDIGAAEVAERIAERLDAPAVLGGYSRLVVDYNRQLDHPTSIVQVSDGVEIPGNANLDAGSARQRAKACFWPYHKRVQSFLEGFKSGGVVPVMVSMHSFTRVLAGDVRPWQIGVMWDEDDRIARTLIETLKGLGTYVIGENEPYSGKEKWGYSIEHHAEPEGLPNVLVEVREDLISDPDAARDMGDLLVDALAPILEDSALYRRFSK
jgi:predicted N-formylglutamate amidohydrolase